MSCLDGRVPAPPLQGAVSWNFGPEGPNVLRMLSLRQSYTADCSRRSPLKAQRLGAEGSPRGCTVLGLPRFSVFPRTRFSVCWRAELWEGSFSALLPFSDGCHACGITPDPFQRAREEEWCNLRWWWMRWTQAEAAPCTKKCTQCSWVKHARPRGVRNRTKVSRAFP